MGSECSVHDDYELDEPIASSNKDWSLFEAKRKVDDFKVTVFIHIKEEKNDYGNDDRIARASKHLKILKHPAVLKHYWSCENSEEFCLVTEPIRPLESVLQTLDSMEIIAGLYNVVQALVFLHDTASLSHNNVCLSSVFVSVNDWAWRLGGMEHACKHPELTNEGGQVNISPKTCHSIDAYAFGMLVSDILDARPDLGDAVEVFGEKIQSLFLHDDPQLRPKLSSLLNADFFRNNFLEVMNFLSHITVKSEAEKEKFFSTLADKLKTIPSKVIALRMLPKLLSRFVLSEPSAERDFLPHLLTPYKDGDDTDYQLNGLTPILPEDLFRKHCIPILITLWSVRDGHARMILLKFFGLHGTSFDKEVLQHFILPQMLIGLRETNDRIVSATFSALSVMVPLLGASVVVGGERRKYFFEGRPKFITSTGLPSVSTIPVLEKKLADTGPSNVSGVIDIENRLSPLPTDDKHAKHEKEKRRQEMEKRKEERKKEMQRRRSQREKERVLQASLKRLAEKSELLDNDSPLPTSDQEEFQPWEDLDDGPSTPRSDITSDRSSQATVEPGANCWSDEHSVTSDHDRLDVNEVELSSTSSQDQRRDRRSSRRVEGSNASQSSRGNPLKLGVKNSSSKINRPLKGREKKVESLVSEYEIPMTRLLHKERDFFADMEPSVSFKAKNLPVQSTSGTLSSKLAMVEHTSQLESGWGEEWEDFDH